MPGLARLSVPLTRFWGERRGIALVEFALVLPVLVLVLLGSYDYGRYVIVHQKVQRTCATIADLIARESQLADGDIPDILAAANHVMSPFTLGGNGDIIISIVTDDGSGLTIDRQYSGAGNLLVASRLGTEGSVPTLPVGLTIEENEVMVVAETFFWFDALFLPHWAIDDVLYDVSYYRPRGNATDFLG